MYQPAIDQRSASLALTYNNLKHTLCEQVLWGKVEAMRLTLV